MENAIFPTDLFIVPFESTKAVKSYGNVFKLILNCKRSTNRILNCRVISR